MIAHLEALMNHETAGDPLSDLKWTRRTTAKVAAELCTLGTDIGARTVARLLKKMEFSLRVNHKKRAGASHPKGSAEGVPDLVEGRWRLLPDCGIGRVFMRKGAATDEGTLQDRARDIYGQQPGAGGMAGEGRATAGSARRVAGEG